MYCPACGQQQISPETRFCSRCGLPLEPVAAYLADPENAAALIGKASSAGSPRTRGLKQGLFIFLLAFFVVPLVALISVQLMIGPFMVAMAAIIFGAGGLLRMMYALLLESGVAGEPTLEEKLLSAKKPVGAPGSRPQELPGYRPDPASDYISPSAGKWRDTNDLQRIPSSATDETTKLLDVDPDQ